MVGGQSNSLMKSIVKELLTEVQERVEKVRGTADTDTLQYWQSQIDIHRCLLEKLELKAVRKEVGIYYEPPTQG